MRCQLTAILVAAAAGGMALAAEEGHLVFDLEARPRETDGSPGHALVAVHWVESDAKTTWRVPLPSRMSASTAPMGVEEAEIYRKDGRRYDLLGSLVGPGVISAGEAILVGHVTGVLALGRKDGATLLDWTAPRSPGADHLYFDSARVEASAAGKKLCAGEGRSGSFLLACDGVAVYFNMSRLAVFREKPWRLVGETAYDRAKHSEKTKGAGSIRATIAAAGVAVTIEGATFMK